jgi:hypothetical protein
MCFFFQVLYFYKGLYITFKLPCSMMDEKGKALAYFCGL